MSAPLVFILIVVGVVVMVGVGVALRRRRAASDEPPDIGLPTDYTSLPIEEPTNWRDRFTNLSVAGKVLLVVVPLLLIVGTIVLVLALGQPSVPDPVVEAPPPAPEITIISSGLVSDGEILIKANSTLPASTSVEAALLADNEPYLWYQANSATGNVASGGKIELRLKKDPNAPPAPGSSDAVSYTIKLTAMVDSTPIEAVNKLSVNRLYEKSFFAVAQAPTPTSPPAPEPTAEAELEPTAEPTSQPPAAITASVFNGGNVRDQPSVQGSRVLDQVNAGENVQLLQKTESGQWFLIKNIRNNVGWVNATLLTVASGAAAQIPVQGSAPLPTASALSNSTPAPAGSLTAKVFNGGNVRNQPSVQGSQVLDQVNAGEDVQLMQKTANGQWYQITNARAKVGWVSATLLAISPATANQVPVQGGAAAPVPAATTAPAPAASPSAAAATIVAAPAATTPPAQAVGGLSARVFNGGNVRDLPNVTGSNVVDQIIAGENVQLVQKSADGQWFQVKTFRDKVGWVNATLLSVDPAVAAKVPVAR